MEEHAQHSAAKIIVEVDADLEDLIPGFLERRQQDIRSLREALAKDDFEQIRQLVHTLKGVGGGYGFDAITSISQQIQLAAENGRSEEIEAELVILANYLERVEVVYV